MPLYPLDVSPPSVGSTSKISKNFSTWIWQACQWPKVTLCDLWQSKGLELKSPQAYPDTLTNLFPKLQSGRGIILVLWSPGTLSSLVDL